jgi:carbamoyl-phosphate synthase large subunit
VGARLLVTGAGTGAGNNVIRSLRTGDPSLFLAGCHADRFALRNSTADRRYLVPPAGRPGFAAALRRIVRAERIDLVLPVHDGDVLTLARLRGRIGTRLFLPAARTIALCQDKYRLSAFLRRRGLPAPATYPVTDLPRLTRVLARLPDPTRAWCRLRRGAGGLGGALARGPAQARAWIRCWEAMRGVPPAAFTVAEYLPGRDLGCQSLWKDGALVLAKTYERLSYLATGAQPAPASSIAALLKTVHEPAVVEICRRAVRALDPRASGPFAVDLREDARGEPRITEINAGRLTSSTNLLDLTGKHNVALNCIRLGLDEPVELRDEYDVAPDHYMLRDVDVTPAVHHADAYFEDILDARR